MATEAISVHVDAEAARPFKATSPGKWRKLEALLSLQLLQAAQRLAPPTCGGGRLPCVRAGRPQQAHQPSPSARML